MKHLAIVLSSTVILLWINVANCFFPHKNVFGIQRYHDTQKILLKLDPSNHPELGNILLDVRGGESYHKKKKRRSKKKVSKKKKSSSHGSSSKHGSSLNRPIKRKRKGKKKVKKRSSSSKHVCQTCFTSRKEAVHPPVRRKKKKKAIKSLSTRRNDPLEEPKVSRHESMKKKRRKKKKSRKSHATGSTRVSAPRKESNGRLETSQSFSTRDASFDVAQDTMEEKPLTHVDSVVKQKKKTRSKKKLKRKKKTRKILKQSLEPSPAVNKVETAMEEFAHVEKM